MGKPINTNIKILQLDPRKDDVTAVVKANPIVILDNVFCQSYYPIFDGYYIKNQKLIPALIWTSWEAGGEPEPFRNLLSFFSNPSSNLYLPVIVINGLFVPLFKDAIVSVIKGLYKKLKSCDRRRRFRTIYYSKKGKVTSYEFPSFASVRDFERGLKEIPKISKRAKAQSYFVRNLKTNKWVIEH